MHDGSVFDDDGNLTTYWWLITHEHHGEQSDCGVLHSYVSLMYLNIVTGKSVSVLRFNIRFSVTVKGRGLSLFWEKFRPTLPSFDLNSRRHLWMQKTSEARVFSLQSKLLPEQRLHFPVDSIVD